MAFIWVQVWAPLPTIHETFMTDTPTGSQPDGNLPNSSQPSRQNVQHLTTAVSYDGSEVRRGYHGSSQSNTPGSFPSVPSFPQQQSASPGRQDSFGMSSLGSALPDAFQGYSNIPSQRYPVNHPASPPQYHQQNAQYAVPAGMTSTTGSIPYNIQYQPQYQGMYAPAHSQSPTNLGVAAVMGSQFYQGQPYMVSPQQSGSFYVQPSQYGVQNQMFPNNASTGQYGVRGGFGVDARLATQHRGTEYLSGTSGGGNSGRSASIASSTGQSSVVRGPPRKPRQSGHAIWIGNLPPHTDLMSLVLHVCKETSGLESLFLISKSNCAFANFKDEESCAAAQVKIHDSRFQTVRLVSRLRRSSVGAGAGASVPTGPAALTPPSNLPVARMPSPEMETKSQEVVQVDEVPNPAEGNPPKDKFFVVKSLTVEDLELSARNGIWATQSHNEETLNKAFKDAENVYLIFSANKSGEYFGYAKMISEISNDPTAAIEFAPEAHTIDDPELPKAIPTPATEFAPKGRIIDDSARGTIFWEVERDEDGSEDDDETRSNSDQDPETPKSKAWGKPFKVEWVSTTRLPFYRTRGLRNPWNSNREVKIARDGTELETSVGRRLIGLFHRLPSPVAPQPPVMSGYPQMRFP
ncbi:uncharacterized protein PAC_00603 [Phialocephala subalpina]|uniref:YTH domain-containing protein n=1 Tax=Phialocephala subalpina TaxID=576137 RepID=A0A1L7WDF2_9HELO|nr:uncharacterized protein PAC_00603 [Phialocephala subalpina]